MTTPSTSAQGPAAGWRYSINYGPDGEENYANVYAADGQIVGNLRTHHAIAICNAFAVCDSLTASPPPAASPASPSGVRVKSLEWEEEYRHGDYVRYCARTMIGGYEASTGFPVKLRLGPGHHPPAWKGPFSNGAHLAETLDAAKAAAQSDYEARILSALAKPATVESEALRALYEWYDRDGSVGAASEVFEQHRAALSSSAGPAEPMATIGFYENEREPRLLSWNKMPNGEHHLYAHPAPATVEMREADIARWKRDSELLSAIQDECWDVRFTSTPNADAGDYNVNIEIVSHFMAEPQERVVGENYNENLRAALEQAMTADAYPPARPVYDLPAALAPATEGRKG